MKKFEKRSAGNTILTMFELESVEPGVMYDVFDGEFWEAEGTTNAKYRAFLSLRNPSEAIMEGEVLDASGRVVDIMPKYSGGVSARHEIHGDNRSLRPRRQIHAVLP